MHLFCVLGLSIDYSHMATKPEPLILYHLNGITNNVYYYYKQIKHNIELTNICTVCVLGLASKYNRTGSLQAYSNGKPL